MTLSKGSVFPLLLLLAAHFIAVDVLPAGEPSFDSRDIVLHAGGVVEFRPPLGWQVWEVPQGREIQLLVAPITVEQGQDREFDGATLVFHASRRSLPLTLDQLASFQQQRLRHTGADLKVEPAVQSQVANCLALTADFARDGRSGQHTMVATKWGVLEIRCESDVSTVTELSESYAQLLASLKFHEPRVQKVAGQQDVLQAAEILGSWKAYRARLSLVGDGRILIRPDVAKQKLDEVYERGGFQSSKPIAGSYRAEQDILYVTWHDGSRMNLRWRLDGDRLLLTDQDGLTTSLRPLFD